MCKVLMVMALYCATSLDSGSSDAIWVIVDMCVDVLCKVCVIDHVGR